MVNINVTRNRNGWSFSLSDDHPQLWNEIDDYEMFQSSREVNYGFEDEDDYYGYDW